MLKTLIKWISFFINRKEERMETGIFNSQNLVIRKGLDSSDKILWEK